MNARNLILAVGALATAGLTAFLVHGWIERQRAELLAQRPVEKAREAPNQILVAKQDLPAGMFVKVDHLQWLAWPEDGIDSNFIKKDQADIKSFAGAVVRKGIVAGEPITNKRIVKPGERGFLAAVLMPGMRAISVNVTPESGISGLVFPGDHVDLILFHKFSEGSDPKSRTVRTAGETVLTNVRVLAMGQTTDDQKGKPIVAKTATLEVTPKQVELLAVAINLGKLSLSLRSLALDDQDQPKPAPRNARGRSYTRDTEVSRLIRAGSNKPTHTVNVLHGSKIQTNSVPKARR